MTTNNIQTGLTSKQFCLNVQFFGFFLSQFFLHFASAFCMISNTFNFQFSFLLNSVFPPLTNVVHQSFIALSCTMRKFRIFLSSGFYVKSIFAILGALRFVNLANFSLQKVQKFFLKKQTKLDFTASKWILADFVLRQSQKLISHKIWVIEMATRN